jgi:hypothetical protein
MNGLPAAPNITGRRLHAAEANYLVVPPWHRYSDIRRAARCVRGTFPGPYKILRELTLTGTLVFVTRCPPTIVG